MAPAQTGADLFGTGPPRVRPATPLPQWLTLAARLRERWGTRLALGTSSWHFPGWTGWVWQEPYPAAELSRSGLAAYAAHPLLGTVSLDRAFYRPLAAAEYAALAAQVGESFRFVVKAPSLVTDAVQRDRSGAGRAPNPHFLDPERALADAVRPAVQGLGARLGVLVFQLSPLPPRWLDDPAALLDRLHGLAGAVRAALPEPALPALEVRDAALLGAPLAALLRQHGWRWCMGVHDRLPPASEQLPMQRALWPGDFVCRWNLQRGQRYQDARAAWAPFDRLRSPDPATRLTLARVARATLDAGHRVFITLNNKAEGSAPASVVALAEALLADR